MQVEVEGQDHLVSICDFTSNFLYGFWGGVKEWMANLGSSPVNYFVFF